jgi:ferredoxin-NADP reductase
MLTEPATSPSTANKQTWYGAIVGFLLPPQVHLFSFYTTPEIALIIGNVFSYLVSPKTKLFPVLRQKIKIANNTAEFVFNPGRKLAYEPGQYMEWTLQHSKYDSRGIRRYFTLASSPTEPNLRIGVKFYDHGSSFKSALLDADEDSPIVASQLSGDFVMPKDTTKKLVFIAGGIGVTPYRSMVKYLLDMPQKRNITLLYSARTKADFAYSDIFEQARRELALKVLYVVTNGEPTVSDRFMRPGRIDDQLIRMEVPDFRERIFYISGTQAMVADMKQLLSGMGMPSSQIKTDFFPGYA